jgi:hypothetical protein
LPPVTSSSRSTVGSIGSLSLGPRVQAVPDRLSGLPGALLLGQTDRTTIIGADSGQPLAVIEAPVQTAVPCTAGCQGLAWSRDAVRAFSLPQGRELWANSVLPPGSSARVICTQIADGSVLVELDWAPTPQGVPQRLWIALDRTSGAELWRRDRGADQWFCPWPRSAAAGDAFVYRTAGGGVGLARARSGAPLWQVDQLATVPDWIAADEHGVVVAGMFGPVIGLDRDSGRIRFVQEIPGRQLAALALDTDRIWTLTRPAASQEQGTEIPELHWLERKSGQTHTSPPWRTIAGSGAGTPHARAGSDDTGLWVVEGALFVTAGDGILRALDRSSGEQIWHWGIGAGALVTMVPDGNLIRPAVRTSNEVWIFEPVAAAARFHDVEIHGRLSLGGQPASRASILVGDSLVGTDGDGYYGIHVSSRGRIQLHAGRPCSEGDDAYEGNAEITIDGTSRHIQADIAAEREGCE